MKESAPLILVVEDDEGLSYLVSDRLTDMDLEVETATTGSAALESLTRRTPTLMLLDYSLPDMTGIGLLDALEQEAFDTPPFIVTTGAGDEQLAVALMKRGASDYLVKDLEFLDLLPQAVRRALHEIEIARRLAAAEREVANQLERYHAILDTTSDGFAIFDREGRFLDVNSSYCDLTGYAREELIGRSLAMLKPAGGEAQIVEMMGKVIERGNLRFESMEITKDDRAVAVEVSAAYNRAHGVIAFIRDISQRVATEKRLRLLSRAVEASPAAIVITDPDGAIQYVNPRFEQVTGYSAEEALGENPRILKSGEAAPEVYEELWDTITAGREWRGEFHNKRKDGVLYWEEASISPIRDATGNIVNFLAIKEEITERKRMADELRQAKEAAEIANDAKSAFLATMSHEIRTPMNSILGMGELLQETDLTETQAWFLKTLNHSGEMLLNLINDILDLSKIEAGQVTLEQTPFELRRLVDETMELFTYSALEKNIHFSHRIDDEVPHWAYGDPTRLRQILMNLVGNAVKFTQKGSVTVNVIRGQGDQLAFSVQDTGPGVSEEKRKEIFQPFTQADATITRKHGGTGLGLTICQRLATLMGGRIRVESQVGRGSIFTFMAPLPKGDEKERQPVDDRGVGPSAVAVESGAGGTLLTILLVEDAPENRMVIQGFLPLPSYQLEIAEDGAQAVDKFRAGRFDLVLMDIQMPVMDGYEATRRIRAWELETGAAPTPIIALTAHAMIEETEQIMEAGCNMHLTKPVRKKRLLEAMAESAELVKEKPSKS